MTAEALGRASDDDADSYPTTWTQADMVFPVTYRFDPGAADDGVTVHVPLAVLGRLTTDGFDWQVPGFRADLVAALMQTLPKDIRRQLIPAAETTAAAYRLLELTDEPLAVALARAVEAAVPSVRVPPRAFDADSCARPPADHLCRARRHRRVWSPSGRTSTRSSAGCGRRFGRPSPGPPRSKSVAASLSGMSAICHGASTPCSAATRCTAIRRCSTTATASRCVSSPRPNCRSG